MLRTYQYRIYPTTEQIQSIERNLNLCRRFYNAMLAHRRYVYKAGGKTTLFDQINELPAIKEEFPEYKLIYSQVLQDVGRRLQKTFDSFFRRLRSGEIPGYPRFKGCNQYHTFTYPQAGFRLNSKAKRVFLSSIGSVAVRLHRVIPAAAKIKNCIVTRDNGRYYVSFSVEMPNTVMPPTGGVVGVDVGITDFAVTSDGDFFPRLAAFRRKEKKLKRLQRAVSRKKKGSNRRREAIRRLANASRKVANQRKDLSHKVVKVLIERYDLIVHEDLRIPNMMQNHHLAKSIQDAGWSLFFSILANKAESAGKRVVKANPYKTSQRCSKCGVDVPKKLTERWHNCPQCGLSLHRDVNAAINILRRGVEMLAS
ncbi:MAG: transposase [Negativicutes bacterium]|nr:transposase [Negativicutes bacterium]